MVAEWGWGDPRDEDPLGGAARVFYTCPLHQGNELSNRKGLFEGHFGDDPLKKLRFSTLMDA